MDTLGHKKENDIIEESSICTEELSLSSKKLKLSEIEEDQLEKESMSSKFTAAQRATGKKRSQRKSSGHDTAS